MEVAILGTKTLKIKGKKESLVVDPQDKSDIKSAIALLEDAQKVLNNNFELVISGPGEYEAGGIKITGVRGVEGVVFSVLIDSINVCIGKAEAIEKLQSKIKEPNVVLAYCGEELDGSFLTSFAVNTVILYGEKAGLIGKSLAGENVKQMQKYSNTIDKLPAEIETIILK